tara:strand:- start:567 stop:974 length:408 start_codon:yes stop_codon:yes gene_type:complete
MTFKMKGWSGFQKSPAKHKTVASNGVVTHGGLPHGHTSRPDSKTPGKEYTDEEMVEKDKNEKVPDYYVSKGKEKEKEAPEGSRYIDTGDGKKTLYTPPKKNKRNKRGTVASRAADNLGKWFQRNVNLKGGVRPKF